MLFNMCSTHKNLLVFLCSAAIAGAGSDNESDTWSVKVRPLDCLNARGVASLLGPPRPLPQAYKFYLPTRICERQTLGVSRRVHLFRNE